MTMTAYIGKYSDNPCKKHRRISSVVLNANERDSPLSTPLASTCHRGYEVRPSCSNIAPCLCVDIELGGNVHGLLEDDAGVLLEDIV